MLFRSDDPEIAEMVVVEVRHGPEGTRFRKENELFRFVEFPAWCRRAIDRLMKKTSNVKQRRMSAVSPARAGGDHSHLDGQCLLGPRGKLAVVLQLESLARVRQGGMPTHWLIPVDDLQLVRSAASLPGEVLWLCRRNPASVLGQLDDGFRGAWWEDKGVAVNLDGQTRFIPRAVPVSAARALEGLAQVVGDLWTGGASVEPRWFGIRVSTVQPTALCAA